MCVCGLPPEHNLVKLIKQSRPTLPWITEAPAQHIHQAPVQHYHGTSHRLIYMGAPVCFAFATCDTLEIPYLSHLEGELCTVYHFHPYSLAQCMRLYRLWLRRLQSGICCSNYPPYTFGYIYILKVLRLSKPRMVDAQGRT